MLISDWSGFKMMEGGYLPVKDVLKHRRFQGFTVEDVKEVIFKQYQQYHMRLTLTRSWRPATNKDML